MCFSFFFELDGFMLFLIDKMFQLKTKHALLKLNIFEKVLRVNDLPFKVLQVRQGLVVWYCHVTVPSCKT